MATSYHLSIVIPVYNEVAVLPQTYARLLAVMEPYDYELIFVDDGSQDASLSLLNRWASVNNRVKVLSFSRNFGHQPAVSAGLHYAKGDAVVLIDADLQDPPEVIPAMVSAWEDGYDVVYGVRQDREGESWSKKITAYVFYRFLRSISDVDIPVDSGDFRLLSRPVVNVINAMPESHRFVRGMTAWAGFRQTGVPYRRAARAAGESKYPWRKMWHLSLDAVTSFSVAPLRWVRRVALTVAFVALIASVLLIRQKLLYPHSLILGWTSVMVSILWLGALQLGAIGIIGEYMAHVVDQVRQRPLYVIARAWNFEDPSLPVTAVVHSRPQKISGEG